MNLFNELINSAYKNPYYNESIKADFNTNVPKSSETFSGMNNKADINTKMTVYIVTGGN